MPIATEAIRLLRCCLSEDGHIVKDACLITTCGGNACKSCIQNTKKYSLNCNYCKQSHYTDSLKKMPNNKSIDILIKTTFLKELVEMLKSNFSELVEAVHSN
jgi:hypothetical protein